jgi:hypothetical protein
MLDEFGVKVNPDILRFDLRERGTGKRGGIAGQGGGNLGGMDVMCACAV